MGPGVSLALGVKGVKSIEDLPWQVAVLDPWQCVSIPWLELLEQAFSLLFDIIYCYPTGVSLTLHSGKPSGTNPNRRITGSKWKRLHQAAKRSSLH